MTEIVDILLSPAERTRLGKLEQTIERGMRTFVEVGQALAEIRDGLLYRDSHDRFEDYCRERWDFNDRRARQLIEAAEITKILAVAPESPAPKNDAQARELAPLREDPDKLRAAWQEAVEAHDGKPTAQAVHEVVQRYREPQPQDPRNGGTPGPRKAQQQAKMLDGIARKAQHILAIVPHLDMQTIPLLPEEERTEWKQQLSEARTALSRVIAAL